MGVSLYALANDIEKALDALTDPENGVDDVTFRDTLEAISGPFEDKIVSVAKFKRSLEAYAKGVDAAIDDMEKRKKSALRRAAELESYIMDSMDRAGIDKVDRPEMFVRVRPNPVSVVIEDESLIPAEFKREEIKTEVKIDKTMIRNAGGCPGAQLVRVKKLEIK